LVVPLVAAAAIAQWQWRGAMVVLAAGVAVVGVAHVIIQRSVRERFVRARHNRLTPPATLSGRSR
jgi:O-antigen ligase